MDIYGINFEHLSSIFQNFNFNSEKCVFCLLFCVYLISFFQNMIYFLFFSIKTGYFVKMRPPDQKMEKRSHFHEVFGFDNSPNFILSSQKYI